MKFFNFSNQFSNVEKIPPFLNILIFAFFIGYYDNQLTEVQ